MKNGDYVRTKYGEIARIDECKGKDKVYKNMEHYETDRMVTKFNNFILYKEDILKTSPNIIDLIERFDLVNGHLVICKMYENEKDIPTIVKCVGDYYFKEEDIKSIVTKEMYSSVEYRVEIN